MHPNVHSITIYNNQGMTPTEVSTDRWMDKEDVVQTYNGIALRHKKKWTIVIFGNMDGPRDNQLSEVSQTKKEKDHINICYMLYIYLTYMWDFLKWYKWREELR